MSHPPATSNARRPPLVTLAVSLVITLALVGALVRRRPDIVPDRRAVFELDEPAPSAPVAPTPTR